MLKHSIAIAAVFSLLVAGSVTAAPQSWSFPLDGLQEVPPVATPGFGSCDLDFDDVTGDFDLACTFSDLVLAASNAHIHGPADYGVSAGVLVQLVWTPAISGTVTGSGTFTPTVLQHVLDHMTYVNVHSSFRPGGEIRGQMVPEPTTAMLLGLGAVTLIARRRR